MDKWTVLRACPLIHRPYDCYYVGNSHFEATAPASVTLSIEASRAPMCQRASGVMLAQGRVRHWSRLLAKMS